jgi:hypothetical protein
MAKEKSNLDPKSLEEMTPEEMQLAIQKAVYTREMLNLDQVQEDNLKRIEERVARSKSNAQRQSDLAAERNSRRSIQQVCRHRQGGSHLNIYKGDGKPCVVRTLMLDGFTYFIQCQRCRLQVFTPHPDMQEKDPEGFKEQKAIYDRMFEMSEDSGLDEIRGPNFFFRKNGVPFIPERV